MAKILFKILLLAITLLLYNSPLLAKDFYVATTGTNQGSCISSPGIGNPCRTISYVITNVDLEPGDIVYMRAGTYLENLNITHTDSGSALGGYVTFKSFGNEDVTLTNSSSYHQIGYNKQNGSNPSTDYVKIDGRGNDEGQHITINGTGKRGILAANTTYFWVTGVIFDSSSFGYGIYLRSINNGTDGGSPNSNDNKGAKYSIIEYTTVINASIEGLKITGWGTDFNTFRYCTIYNGCSTSGINVSGSGYQANPPDSNIIHNNSVYSTDTNGLNVVSYSSNTEVYNNEFYNNSSRGFTAGGTGGIDGITIYNNEIHNNGYYGLSLENFNGALVYNNLLYDNGNTALMIQNNSTNHKILNNTVYGSSGADDVASIYIKSGCTGVDVINNILANVDDSDRPARSVPGDGLFENNNLIKTGTYYVNWGGTSYSNIDTFNSSEPEASGNIFEDPQLDANYRPTSNTPSGLGHTVDGGLTFSGIFTIDKDGYTRSDIWDLGAYEYRKIDLAGPNAPTGLKILN